MSIFKDLVYIDDNGDFLYNQWVEWDHFFIPNTPDWLREIMRNLMEILGHCKICSVLDGCYFISSNMPKQPLHNNCDCKTTAVDFVIVQSKCRAECDIRKFTEYVFKDDIKSKGKNKIFYDLGFNVDDSEYLKMEFCKQAREQYLSGNYILKNLDSHGQRIAIKTTINEASFYSGWILCPEGKIKNTTPFGGWVK